MALTKLQALDKFCDFHNYARTKLENETKTQFLQRKQKEWSLQCVEMQVRNERNAEAKVTADSDITNVDI